MNVQWAKKKKKNPYLKHLLLNKMTPKSLFGFLRILKPLKPFLDPDKTEFEFQF